MEGLAIGLVLLVHWVGEPARHTYDARVAALRAAGQPLRYEDLETPAVPDEENAAVALAEASQTLRMLDAEQPAAFYRLDQANEEEREEMRAYLASLKPYFDLLAKVPERPRWHVDHAWKEGPGFSVPEIPWLQEAICHLEWRAELDADPRGRTRRAADAAVLALDLAERCRLPMLIGHLVRCTVAGTPTRILRVACRQPGFDAAEFRRIVDPRLAREVPGPPKEILAQERVFILWAVDTLRQGRASMLDDWLPMKGMLHKSPRWRLFLYLDGIRGLDALDEAISLADTTPGGALRAAAEHLRAVCRERALCPISGLSTTVIPRFFEMHAKSVAVGRLTRVVMALLEYRQREGEWPESLATLGDLPADPYSGKAFLYERTKAGARIRAAKQAGAERDVWEVLEEEDLAWTSEN